MSLTTRSRTLIAKWTRQQDPSVDLPHTVHWSDGSTASTDDYLTHSLDTHTCKNGIDGMELRMFPDIVAVVHYDRTSGAWVISGVGVKPTVLNISDRDASDDCILAELYTWPTVYRARIHR